MKNVRNTVHIIYAQQDFIGRTIVLSVYLIKNTQLMCTIIKKKPCIVQSTIQGLKHLVIIIF